MAFRGKMNYRKPVAMPDPPASPASPAGRPAGRPADRPEEDEE